MADAQLADAALESMVGEIADDFTRRHQRGEHPSLDEYAERYPELAGLLREILPAIVALSPSSEAQRAETPRASQTAGGGEHAPPPARIGDYEILAEIGRGGMGVVYKARHRALGRIVALKMLRSRDAADLERFRHEAQAVALLQHPNVVQIFEVQEMDGQAFLSLEYVSGGSLAERTKGEPQPPRDAAVLVETLAIAIAAAHDRGLVHRDLKPSNVLLQIAECRSSNGSAVESAIASWPSAVPKISDFGLAKRIDQDQGHTQTGAIVGTPSYMAPEQAVSGGAVGPAADIFALGAILYELIAGRPPFKGPSVLETLELVRHADPIPPSQLQPGCPRDLETICLTCLQKEPARRYATARAVAEDLGRFLGDRPIEARRASWSERAWRWCRRNPAIATASASAVAALLIGLGIALWQWRQAQRNFHRAEANFTRAHHDFDLAHRAVDQMLTRVGSEHLLVVPHMEQARRAILMDALRFYEELLKYSDDRPESRLAMARAHWRVANIHGWLGDFAPAAHHYDQALLLTQDSPRDGPTATDWRQLTAAVHLHRGWLRDHLDQTADAENDYRHALAIWEQLDAEAPVSPEFRYRLAFTLLRLGGLLYRISQPDAESFQRRALALSEQMQAEQPENKAPVRLLVASLHDVAVTLQRRGDLTGAEKLYRQALEPTEKLALATDDSNDRHHFAMVQSDLALLLVRNRGSAEEVDRLNQQSLDANQRLVKEFPTAPEYRFALASGLHNRGIGFGRSREAEAAYVEAAAEWRSLSDKYPQVAKYQHKLGGTLHNHALILFERGEPAAARPLFEEALVRGSQAVRSNPDNTDYVQYLTNHYHSLARVYIALTLHGDAERIVRQRLDWAVERATTSASTHNRAALARAHEELGRTYREGGRFDEAKAEYGHSIAIWRQIVADSPDNADHRSELGAGISNATTVFRKQERWSEMVRPLEEAIQHQEAALAIRPGHAPSTGFLLIHYWMLTDAQLGLGEHVPVARTATALRVRFPDRFNDFVWASQLARCIPLAEKDQRLPHAERDRLLGEYADKSMALLQAAQRKKSKDLLQIHTQSAFKVLHDRKDFQELLAKVPKATK